MKKFINYNIAKFKTSNLFVKFFMLSIWPFCLFILFNPWSSIDGPLAFQGGSAWVMIVFISVFGLLFPVKNYIEVNKVVKHVGKNPSLKDKYRDLLKVIKEQK